MYQKMLIKVGIELATQGPCDAVYYWQVNYTTFLDANYFLLLFALSTHNLYKRVQEGGQYVTQ